VTHQELLAENLQLKLEIEKLRNIIHSANRKKYGRKSEKLSAEQKALFVFEPVKEVESEAVTVKAHKRIKRGRKPLPADLPRERIEYEPENLNCACCGKEMVKIGEEVTEELEFVPAKFKVIEHVKIKRACNSCKDKVEIGQLPNSVQPLERSRPGAGLLSHIILSKYADHLPLYRQEEIFSRLGIELPRSRMSDWIGRIVDEYFVRIWDVLKKETLSSDYVQADETSIKVRDLELLKKDQRLFTGYFWAVHAPPNLAFFEYHPTRASTAAKEVLKDFNGTVQTDAYAGYNAVLLPDEVIRLACMAHIRRKFIEARRSAPKDCDRILLLIAKLYHFEDKWKEFEAEKRTELRQSIAKPVFDDLQEEIQNTASRLLPQHALQKALQYAVSQRTSMALYLTDGKFLIDNNLVEGRIRPIALGRKNYLFAGSHNGATRAAVLYSLLACCKLNKVNPWEWFTDVIKRLPSYPVNRLVELLPHRWTPAKN
jgi:transposase